MHPQRLQLTRPFIIVIVIIITNPGTATTATPPPTQRATTPPPMQSATTTPPPIQRANKDSIELHSYSALSGGGRSLGPNDEGSSCMTLSANARSSPRGRSTRERKGAEECVPYLLDGEDEVLVLLVKHDDGHLHAAKLADARGWAWSATTQHAAISPPCSWGSEPRATVSRSEGRRKKLTTAGTCRTGSPAGSHPSPQPAP